MIIQTKGIKTAYQKIYIELSLTYWDRPQFIHDHFIKTADQESIKSAYHD